MFRFLKRKSKSQVGEKLLCEKPQHPVSENKKEFLYIKYDSAEKKLREVLTNWNLMKVQFVRKIDTYELRIRKEREILRKEKRKLHVLYQKKLDEIEKRSNEVLQKYENMKEGYESGYIKLRSAENITPEKKEKIQESKEEEEEVTSQVGINIKEEDHDVELEPPEETEEEETEKVEKEDDESTTKDDEKSVQPSTEDINSKSLEKETSVEEEEEVEVEEDDESEETKKEAETIKSNLSTPDILQSQSENVEERLNKKIEEQKEEMKMETDRLMKEAEEYRQKFEEVSSRLEKLNEDYEKLGTEKQSMESAFETKVKKLLESKENLEKQLQESVLNEKQLPYSPSSSVPQLSTSTSPVIQKRTSEEPEEEEDDENNSPPPPLSTITTTTTTTTTEKCSVLDQPRKIVDTKNVESQTRIIESIDDEVQTEGEIFTKPPQPVIDISKYRLRVETEEKTVQAELIPQKSLPQEEEEEEEEKKKTLNTGVDEVIDSPWGKVINEEKQQQQQISVEEEEKRKRKEEELEKKVERMGEELKTMTTKCSEKEEENKNLKNEVEVKSKNIEIFESKVKDLESELSQAEVKMKSLLEEYDRYKEEQTTTQNQYQKELEIQKKLLESHKLEMDSKPEIPLEVQMELDSLKGQINQKDEVLAKIKSEVEGFSEKISLLEEEKKRIEEELSLVKGQKNQVEEKLKNTLENLEETNSKLSKMKESFEKLQAEKKSLEESQKQSSDALIQKQKELESQVAALTNKASQLKKLGEDYQAQKTVLEEKNEQLGIKMKKVEEIRDKSIEQNKMYEDQIEQLNSEKQDMEEKFNQFNEQSAKLEENLQQMKEKCEKSTLVNKNLEKSMKNLEANTAKYKKLLEKSEIQRKRLHNIIEDSKGKIRVYMRCRPMSKTELERGCKNVVSFESPFSISINDVSRKTVRHYEFTKSFDPNSTQEQVYGDTKDLILSAVDGYNVCIFAYGQTGSGKTFTIGGEKPDHVGIVDRGINDIFKTIKKKKRMYRFQVECYMVEVYLDRLYDLFAAKGKGNAKYDIKKNVLGQVVVTNVIRKRVRTAEECLSTYENGLKNRHTRSTAMNDSSSRSHLIFSILIIANNPQKKTTTYGKLSLVDLAGSERMKKTNITDSVGLKEGMAINKSLSALGNVINALSSKKKFVPYRDDKLTLLLSDSIGGTAKTLMFVCISPADYNVEETCNSLLYANRAKMIVNKVEQQNETSLNKKYRMQIELLRESLQSKCENDEEYDMIIDQILSSLKVKKLGGGGGAGKGIQSNNMNINLSVAPISSARGGGGGSSSGRASDSSRLSVRGSARNKRSRTPQPKGSKKNPNVSRRSRTPKK